MNILFLTIGRMDSISSHGIYPDLLRQFRDNGHSVYVVSPRERRTGLSTELRADEGVHMLYVSVGNITKCGKLEKGISTLMIEGQYLNAIKRYFGSVRFDVVLYSTPPITLVGVVKYLKKRDNARTYLLLKDIFPQNAVDLGMLRKTGIKGILYSYFRSKEKELYAVSDFIGCMSQANVDYVLRNNPTLDTERVTVCPNAIEPRDVSLSNRARHMIRERYSLPIDKKVFVYGGNLGKPQGISFLIECLRETNAVKDAFFLIIGDGTEYGKLDSYIKYESPDNVKLLKSLPKDEYDGMLSACDVGMLFLDHRFTIPNFPSRMLTYMQAGLPILCCTDPNTDVGKVVSDGGFGWWCESNDPESFCELVRYISMFETSSLSKNAKDYLYEHYNVSHVYRDMIDALQNN